MHRIRIVSLPLGVVAAMAAGLAACGGDAREPAAPAAGAPGGVITPAQLAGTWQRRDPGDASDAWVRARYELAADGNVSYVEAPPKIGWCSGETLRVRWNGRYSVKGDLLDIEYDSGGRVRMTS